MTNIFSNIGRATRREFWTTCLMCVLFISITGPMVDSWITNPTFRGFGIFWIVFITCWGLGCVTRKRCRDLGISSWRQFDPRYCLDIPFKKGRD